MTDPDPSQNLGEAFLNISENLSFLPAFLTKYRSELAETGMADDYLDQCTADMHARMLGILFAATG